MAVCPLTTGPIGMLQLIRNKSSSWFMLIILFVALFALTFFGIGDYFTSRVDTHVAKVGDSRIEQADYEQRYQVWRSNMRQMMGEDFDPSILDQPMWREQILQQMVDEAVLRNANERMGLVVPVVFTSALFAGGEIRVVYCCGRPHTRSGERRETLGGRPCSNGSQFRGASPHRSRHQARRGLLCPSPRRPAARTTSCR